MATFYIQLENKLLQISGELTAENISKALGYVPVDSSTLNNYATKEEVSSLVDMSMVEELSQRVDNISFDNLKDNPFLLDGSGELNIVDEQGNVIAKVDSNGLHSVDFIAGEHRLTDKIDSTALSGYATEKYVDTKISEIPEVDLTDYAKSEDILPVVTEEISKIVANAPDNFDTLKEIADYIASDQTGAAQLANRVTELEDAGFLTEHQDISHLATKEELDAKDFYTIQNNPILNEENGKLLFVDETGNVGLQLEEDNTLRVKDVIAGENLLSNKADISYVDQKIDAIPITDLTGYATEEWVEDKNYLTEHQDISHLATKEEIPSLEGYAKTEDIPSTEGLATEEFVTSQGYLTEIPSEYITDSELNSKGYATKSELNSIDFDHINNTPFTNDESGELNITDEQGNLGIKLSEDGIYVKDVVAGEHVLSNKQDVLVSGSNIKTINGESILGGGDIVIGGKIYENSVSNNITLSPNHMYVRNYSFGQLTISGFETTKGEGGYDTLSDEYWIMLHCTFIELIAGIIWPDEYDIQWVDGAEPEIEIGKSYIFHITRYRHPVNLNQNLYLVDYKVFKKLI